MFWLSDSIGARPKKYSEKVEEIIRIFEERSDKWGNTSFHLFLRFLM